MLQIQKAEVCVDTECVAQTESDIVHLGRQKNTIPENLAVVVNGYVG